MNTLTRSIIVAATLGLCLAGWTAALNHRSPGSATLLGWVPSLGSSGDYQFASADRESFNWTQLETIVRAKVAMKYPGCRIEFGSGRLENHQVILPVVLAAPNREARAFLYRFIQRNGSWKVVAAQPLWFVPASRIARGLRV